MDTLDRLIASMSRAGASGRAGIFDDEENASKLLAQELGTRDIPARPTLSPAYDEAAIMDDIAKGLDGMLAGRSSGLDAVATAVGNLAEKTRENIDSNTPPPLAESTIAKRQARGNSSTRTLVDTWAMRAAVRSEVKRGADGWGDG